MAPKDAIRWYQQALDLLDRQGAPDKQTQAEVLTDLGSAQRLARIPNSPVTLLRLAELAEQLDNPNPPHPPAPLFPSGEESSANDNVKRVAGSRPRGLVPNPSPIRVGS